MTITPEDVRAELERVLASKGFASAGRMSRLLRHAVEKTLAGETDQLKEYTVGVEVFDRDASYDPRLDSIVRVEAGRLRSRLDEYYAADGAASPIRISLPRGGYAAHFEARPSIAPATTPIPPPAAPPHGSKTAWPLAAGLTLTVAVLVLSLAAWRSPAASGADVAVLPFAHHSLAPDDAALAARLTENVSIELARLGTVGVASHTSAIRLAGAGRPLPDIAKALGTAFVLEASVEREGAGVLIMARLVDAATDRKVWVADYRGEADDARGLSQRLAFDVSAELARRAR